ncbi:DUF1592 domain-containing protein [Novipirellula sp.]|uniref:DUF1592 domain-containing protein n=1 Tax=Novipirellula sp. TaxID=2795430 RepID=UPI00356329E5
MSRIQTGGTPFGNPKRMRGTDTAWSLAYAAGYLLLAFSPCSLAQADDLRASKQLLNQYCGECHGDGADEGEFELKFLQGDLAEPANFDAWKLVHDRINTGVMPPPDAEQPTAEEVETVLAPLADALAAAQKTQQAELGRVTARRLNAIEFETTLSDLLQTPLDIADLLPADAKAEGFSTVGSALNISSVQMEAYLQAIDSAIDQAVQFTEKPETQKFRLSLLNSNGYMQVYRAEHPTLPVVDGMILYATESMSAHNALWGQYVVPRTGKYRIKVSAYKVNSKEPIALTMRVGGNGHKESLRVKHRLLEHLEIASDRPEVHEWEGELLRGHFLHLYPSELPVKRFPKNQKYEQVTWDGPGVCVQWLEIEGPITESWPPQGQEVLFGGVTTEPITGASNPDPNVQLHSPPIIPADPITLPDDWPKGGNKWERLAGQLDEDAKFVAQDYSRRRGKVVREILEGKRKGTEPLPDYQMAPYHLPIGSPLPSYGGEPIYKDAQHPGDLVRTMALAPKNPKADAERLVRRILPLAFRRAVTKSEADRYVAFVHDWLDEGVRFESAMRTGYKAIFTSPQFLFHQSTLSADESTGDFALAERLAYFLWCSTPDRELLRLAQSGELAKPEVLRQQTERMISDKRSGRFIEDFLGQWLDLYEIEFTTPDLALFPEYDPVLHWSMLSESHAFFQHLLNNNLPARNLIDSDFITINRRLAEHYGISGVTGMQPSVVKVPRDSMRGGVMTQAAVLKVTANGTNTSPVVRGTWVLERILGTPSPPPPPGVPAVEPDIRGAVTLREQLEKHRSDSACASCHAKIDPPGIALESFDPVGRFRTNYRILNPELAGLKKYDRRIRYDKGLPVDPSYRLPSGQEFADVRELKRIYTANEREIARMMVDRLLVYSTGATTTFADRSAIEEIVARTEVEQFGVRSIIHAVVQSELFRSR